MTDSFPVSVICLVQEEHVQSWTLSGREAEALHAQEEDEAAIQEEDEEEEEDPIKKIIQSRYCIQNSLLQVLVNSWYSHRLAVVL